MNTDTTNASPAADDVIDGAITEVKTPDNALVVTNPEQYARELFEPFHRDLTRAKRQASSKPYNITTPEGLAAAKEFRITFQKIRTKADKLKSERKKPIDQAGKALLTGFNTLATLAQAEEAKHATAIEAEEARQAAERQRKIDEERERVEALQRKVDMIRVIPEGLVGKPSTDIQTMLDRCLAARLVPADYQEYFEDALAMLETTINTLRQLLDNALQAEAEERKRQDDLAELERLRAQQAKREKEDAERKRLDDEAAAENARQLAAQQAALTKQKESMLEIQAMQSLAMLNGTARELHKSLTDLQAIEVDAEKFGDMAPMAQMARDMAIGAIDQRYKAALAIELEQAHTEALDEDAQRAELEVQAERVNGTGSPPDIIEPDLPYVNQDKAPAPRRAFIDFGSYQLARAPAPAAAPVVADQDEAAVVPRPANEEILDLVANHYCVFPATVLVWLRDLVKEVQA